MEKQILHPRHAVPQKRYTGVKNQKPIAIAIVIIPQSVEYVVRE